MIKRNELKGPSCLTNAADDEPIFVLRSSDEIAPLMVRIWAMNYRKQKSAQPGGMTQKQQGKYIEALNLADAMDAYRAGGVTLAMHPVESVDAILVDGQQDGSAVVKIPESSAEAELMAKTALSWLEANDPNRLTQRGLAQERVCKLASELCNAIDSAEEDIGGHRPVSEILKQLGPACYEWERR